jgi:uncharacterized protein YgbK (DUF1537 family)
LRHIQLEDTFIFLLYSWSLRSIEHYIWQAELKGRSFLCRTAASFVSALIGIIPKDPVLPKDFESNKESSGALIVVGSYVPKTTKQVEELQSQHNQNLRSIEISVEKVALKSSEVRDEEIRRAVEMADAFLRAGRETLIMSSRELITGKSCSLSQIFIYLCRWYKIMTEEYHH